MKPSEVVMGNIKSNNVEVGDHDVRPASQSKAEWEVVQLLTKRIFLLRQHASQTFYYDAVTGATNLTLMHLIQIAIELAPKGYNPGNVISKDNALRQLIKNTYFLPIINEPQYHPGKLSRAVKIEGLYYPNSWRKPECVPTAFASIEEARSQSGAARFIEHLQLMLADNIMDLDHSESKTGYLIRMLAYRYQVHDFRKRQKPHVAFYFYGKQGFGKGIFSNILNTVFGESAVKIVANEGALTNGSQVDVFRGTWAIVDETNINKGSTDYNTIKSMTGQTFVESSRKHEHFKRWYVPAQLIMFSQQPPTFIEPGDRRFFINRFDTEFESQEAKDDYFKAYTHWLSNEDGYAAIAGLLAATDITDVRIESPPLMTDDKKMVINMVTDYPVADIKEIIDQHPDRVCFVADDFSTVWAKYDIKIAGYKYKLMEAGLSDTGKHRYSNLHRHFWIRDCYRLPRKQGSRLILEHKVDQSKTRLLSEDPGYIFAMDMARPDSYGG